MWNLEKKEKPRHLHGLVKNYPHSYQGFYVQLIIIAACHLPCNMANALVSQGWGGSLSNPGTFREVGFWRGGSFQMCKFFQWRGLFEKGLVRGGRRIWIDRSWWKPTKHSSENLKFSPELLLRFNEYCVQNAFLWPVIFWLEPSEAFEFKYSLCWNAT